MMSSEEALLWKLTDWNNPCCDEDIWFLIAFSKEEAMRKFKVYLYNSDRTINDADEIWKHFHMKRNNRTSIVQCKNNVGYAEQGGGGG